MDTPFRHVVVLGGGSAGFLAALALNARLPQLDVTVVQTDAIPVIGVGEGTVRGFTTFMHRELNLDPQAFYEETGATWKLGLRLDWGPPSRTHFNYGFGTNLNCRFKALPRRTVHYCLDGLDSSSFQSVLMDLGRSPLYHGPCGGLVLHPHFGHHIENARFIRYLQRQAHRRGVRQVDRQVLAVPQEASGAVRCLRLDDGSELTADLFVDASGFASVLLGRTLREEYISFAGSLLCDAAVTGFWRRSAPVLPYTTAETMDSGWCWRIDLRDRVNRGYVFSSAFCTPEQAVAEMRRKNPQMEDDHRVVRFRSGRYRRCWVQNVVGVGNASGFVEPLEASSLGMIAMSARVLCQALQDSDCRPTEAQRRSVNAAMADGWDDLREFLAIHYAFNTRLDTPFWRHCRENTDLGRAREVVAYYQEHGPFNQAAPLIRTESGFGVEGYLCMLVGLGVPTRYRPSLTEDERETWALLQASMRAKADRALPMEEALRVIDERRYTFPSGGLTDFRAPARWSLSDVAT